MGGVADAELEALEGQFVGCLGVPDGNLQAPVLKFRMRVRLSPTSGATVRIVFKPREASTRASRSTGSMGLTNSGVVSPSFSVEKGPLEVEAQDFGGKNEAGRGSYAPDRVQDRRHGGRKGRGDEPGHAAARLMGGDGPESLDVAVDHVPPEGAVEVKVDESRRDEVLAVIQNPFHPGQGGAPGSRIPAIRSPSTVRPGRRRPAGRAKPESRGAHIFS